MDITTEVLTVIANIHTGLKQLDPKAAHLFRMGIIMQTFDPDSIVWESKLDEGTVIVSSVTGKEGDEKI